MGMFGGRSLGDVLSIIGAGLKDASPGSNGDALANVQALLMQRQQKAQQLAFLQSVLGQGAPAGGDQAAAGGAPAAGPPARSASGLSLTDPNLARNALIGKMLGVDLSPSIDVLKAQQPHLSNFNGFAVNDKDGSQAGKYFPTLDKGQEPLFDSQGNFAGVRNASGAVQSAAEMAGATSGATEAAKAAYDLVPVPIGNGQTQLMPRLQASQLLAGRGGGGPAGVGGPVPGGGVQGGAGGQLGLAPSPAEQELAKARAATQGLRETDMQGARAAMQQVDDQTNMIAQNLHDMLGETQDPNTGKWVKTKPSMISGLSTGSATDIIDHVPLLNQQERDLKGKIETVRNGTSFNSMQAIKQAMAASGDGGGASVRMTDQTARMLGEINGSLNQDQSGPQFEATVRRHLQQLDALNQARHDLFSSQYQDILRPKPGRTAPIAPNYAQPRTPTMAGKGYKIISVQ